MPERENNTFWEIAEIIDKELKFTLRMDTYHEYTTETIYHFNCGECSNWWSYAGIIKDNQSRPPSMTCPHCGYKTKVKLKEGWQPEK